MLLTLVMIAAAWFRHFKLRNIRHLISSKYNDKLSLVFYKTDIVEDDKSSTPASEICSNYDVARVKDIIWQHKQQKGCLITPKQKIDIGSWISFSKTLNYLPFNYDNNIKYNLDERSLKNLVLEIETSNVDTNNIVEVESYGEALAWKMDTRLYVLMKTDILHLCKLLTVIFYENMNVINNGFSVLRVISVDFKGVPQPIEELLNHSRNNIKNSESQCLKNHLKLLKNMNILAYQANEYDLKKVASKTVTIPNSVGLSARDLLRSNSCSAIENRKPEMKNTKKNNSNVIVKNRREHKTSRPPNIFVYSTSPKTIDDVITTLNKILENDKFTIYPLNEKDVNSKLWLDCTQLLVVAGNISEKLQLSFLDFFFKGGKILCLCSDMLHLVAPNFGQGTVTENKLVQFTYKNWKNVTMIRDKSCHNLSNNDKIINVLQSRQSHKATDVQGISHNLKVKVLDTENNGNIPSLIRVSSVDPKHGTAFFAQVHLETNPKQFADEIEIFDILTQNETSRLQILADILNSYFDLSLNTQSSSHIKYDCGYLLGKQEVKFALIENLKNLMNKKNIIVSKNISFKFVGSNETTPKALFNFLPIMMDSSSECFSNDDYFDNLKTKSIGQLLIYVKQITSSMFILNDLTLNHGIVVVTRRQTQGQGRSSNQWLSPEGCLMYSMQLHIPVNSAIGSRISILQHIIAVATVKAIHKLEGCQKLNISLKWPNDIYANKTTKIAGFISNCQFDGGSTYICNIGCGLNFSNSVPTLCIFDMIKEFNLENNANIPLPSFEQMLALIFSEIENLYETIQISENFDLFYKEYYQLWMHSNAEVTVVDSTGLSKQTKINGIDEFGYLLVQVNGNPPESVHPDGNSFDILRGLIYPK